MEACLKAVVAAAVQRCRQAGAQCDAAQLAYTACLLEERQAWGVSDCPAQQQQPALTLTVGSKLPEAALAAMAGRLSNEVLQPPDRVAAAAARLQVALEAAFKQQQAAVEAEQAAHEGAAAGLAAKVAHKRVTLQAATLPTYQAAFEGVVDYVCAAAGLQARAAADAGARAQVAAALESAFPLSGVAFFLTLTPQERLQQLDSLAAISCGICLFNSFTGNAPSPLTLSAPTQLLQAERLLAAVQAAAAEAEAALDHHNCAAPAANNSGSGGARSAAGSTPDIAAQAAEEGQAGPEGVPPDAAAGGAAGPALGAVLFCVQAVVTLRSLGSDLAAGISCCTELHTELEAALLQAAQHAAQASSGAPAAAVPKDAVFPLFESAGRLHHALTGELRLLLVRARLWESACEALAASAAGDAGVPRVLGFQPKRRLSASHSGAGSSSQAGGRCSSAHATGSAGSSSSLPELPLGMEFVPQQAPAAVDAHATAAEPQQLSLSGMCPVSIAGSVAAGSAAVLGTGVPQVLLGRMARPEVGAIRYNGQQYGFCSAAALAAFVDAPELVLDAVWLAAHAVPLLYAVLCIARAPAAAAPAGSPGRAASPAASARPLSAAALHHQAGAAGRGSSPVAARGSSAGGGGGGRHWAMPPLRALLDMLEAPLRVDAGTQTVTHLHERCINKDYEWNEWALRRRVLALANLRLKATHSAQTAISAFRREGSSQTWLPKEAAVQTKANKGSSVPRKLRYVTGLRGAPDARMRVVSLELDVHGQGVGVKHAR